MATTITAAALRDAAKAVGIEHPFDDAAFARLAEFVARRGRWAGTHNLSGPRALHDPWQVDVLDGLALAASLAPELPLVDVGAGSGIPGMLVACLEPERTVHLVEPIAKRTAFLRTAAVQMGLRGVRVHRARWPHTIPGPQQVVSRAVVDPAVWPGLAASAGDQVVHVLRMLADKRPPVDLPDFTCTHGLEYALQGAPRRVERWTRQPA